MPEVLQMPRRTQPASQDSVVRRSVILPDKFEESESLGKIQRWLEIADSALEDERTSGKMRPA